MTYVDTYIFNIGNPIIRNSSILIMTRKLPYSLTVHVEIMQIVSLEMKYFSAVYELSMMSIFQSSMGNKFRIVWPQKQTTFTNYFSSNSMDEKQCFVRGGMGCFSRIPAANQMNKLEKG